MRIWFCKIGEAEFSHHGADAPMRQAVQQAYKEITGQDCVFCFSGWGAQLTEPERAVVENRLPRSTEPSGEVMGMKIVLDPSLPVRTIHIKDVNGNILGSAKLPVRDIEPFLDVSKKGWDAISELLPNAAPQSEHDLNVPPSNEGSSVGIADAAPASTLPPEPIEVTELRHGFDSWHYDNIAAFGYIDALRDAAEALERDKECLVAVIKAVMAIPDMTNEQLAELKANCVIALKGR